VGSIAMESRRKETSNRGMKEIRWEKEKCTHENKLAYPTITKRRLEGRTE
jgi:hypothetical protein